MGMTVARRLLMALGALSFLAAIAGGLVRLGWALPAPAGVVAFHGPLVVVGFLGTVIGLERAVALGRAWAYAGPAATALGAAALVTGAPGGAPSMLLGSAVATVAVIEIVRVRPADFTLVAALGAGAWLIAQVLWVAGWPIHRLVHWWMAFLVLTVASERLELARERGLGLASRAAFLSAIGFVLLGNGLGLAAPALAARIGGAGMLAMAAWLVVFDVARADVRAGGVARFGALALLSGYAWLGVTGLLALRFGAVTGGLAYDAVLHALFVGFVFSMIFAHASTVMPAMLGLGVTVRRAPYAPLALLHASLVLRVVGDGVAWMPGRRWGGLLNVIAIVGFFAALGHGLARPHDEGACGAGARQDGEA